MSDTVIQVENLGKKYIIGHQQQESYTALRDVIAKGIKSLGHQLLTPLGKRMSNPAVEEFWALKDVSFEVNRGDCIGIIGRNGAGKSTLLKILSRITEPTTGRISIKGRVASLLEVGTGFHAELTGRENIFLNGAILGMSRTEIKKKFDEIVAFAEVEKFLDTPVKRYSSGMYVRLAFAVAAHLEPEILVVDEVLAVGDAAFQKKCLGKMEDAAQKEGRTVLFVSHNMAAVNQLCSRAFLLKNGAIADCGQTQKVIEAYLTTDEITGVWNSPISKKGSNAITLTKAIVLNSFGEPSSMVSFDENFFIAIYYKVNFNPSLWTVVFRITNSAGQDIFTTWDTDTLKNKESCSGNTYRAICSIPSLLLKPGIYTVSLATYSLPTVKMIEYYENAFSFEVSVVGYTLNEGRWGAITPVLDWHYEVV